MKVFLAMTLAVFLMSCKSTKEVTDNGNPPIEETPKEQVDPRVVGYVKLQNQGCDVLLEVDLKGEKTLMYPVNLEDKFKKEGLKLMFQYLPSKKAIPLDCKANICIVMSDVSAYRR